MDIYTALAQPHRRQILELIAKHGAMTASDIATNFTISAPAISQHLRTLLEARLVVRTKNAQQRIYALNPDWFLEYEEWKEHILRISNNRLDNLENILQKTN